MQSQCTCTVHSNELFPSLKGRQGNKGQILFYQLSSARQQQVL